MKAACVLAAAALLAVPVALASRVGPEPYRRPHVPRAWEQHRALAMLFRRGLPVYCGGGRSNAVALTFDDGPSNLTGRLVAELRAGGARATFFVVGNRLEYWPEAIRDERAVGAIGNHTWSHSRLTDLPRWLVWLELARTQWATQRELGWKPRIFRAPYELHDRTTDAVVHSLGLVDVLWSVDSGDSAHGVKVADVVRNVVAGLRPGAIILMHDMHPWTVRALPQILAAVRLRGLRAVTVPELLAIDPPRAANRHCLLPRPVAAR
jgi:peptidoglycan/xylan/chitin deacetylase (PgdA/CDA1 family)